MLHPGIETDDLRRVNQWLLGSGFSIEDEPGAQVDLRDKGGGLLRHIGERKVTGLLISDVRWDDPAVIGSGLLVAERNDEEAPGSLRLPDWITALTLPIDTDQRAVAPDVDLHIVASLNDAREAAAQAARALATRRRSAMPLSTQPRRMQDDAWRWNLWTACPASMEWAVSPAFCCRKVRGVAGATSIWRSRLPL